MRTDGDGETRTLLSRRAFVAAAGGHVGIAMAGGRAAAADSNDHIRVAATEPYRHSLRRTVNSYRRTKNDRTIEIKSTGTNAASRLHDDNLDILISGQPSFSAADVASDTDRYVTVTDWAALELPDDSWRNCLRQQQVRNYWDGEIPVEVWSESDWDSVASVARTSKSVETKRSDTTSSKSVTLVRGTRAYQYARGFGGLGYYPIEDRVLDRNAAVRLAKRRNVAPLVRLGYVHADENVGDGNIRTFLQTLDRRTDRSHDVVYFPSPIVSE